MSAFVDAAAGAARPHAGSRDLHRHAGAAIRHEAAAPVRQAGGPPRGEAAPVLRPPLSIDFTRKLDALAAGRLRRGAALALGMTPSALRRAGLPALPLLYRQGEARKTLLEKHAGTIDAETLRRLPDAIADPVLVIAQDNGRYGALIRDGRGQDVLVVIAPSVEVGRRPVNLVVTVHARPRPDGLLADVAHGRVRYRHAARSLDWLDKAWRQQAGCARQEWIEALRDAAQRHRRRGPRRHGFAVDGILAVGAVGADRDRIGLPDRVDPLAEPQGTSRSHSRCPGREPPPRPTPPTDIHPTIAALGRRFRFREPT